MFNLRLSYNPLWEISEDESYQKDFDEWFVKASRDDRARYGLRCNFYIKGFILNHENDWNLVDCIPSGHINGLNIVFDFVRNDLERCPPRLLSQLFHNVQCGAYSIPDRDIRIVSVIIDKFYGEKIGTNYTKYCANKRRKDKIRADKFKAEFDNYKTFYGGK